MSRTKKKSLQRVVCLQLLAYSWFEAMDIGVGYTCKDFE